MLCLWPDQSELMALFIVSKLWIGPILFWSLVVSFY